MLKYRFSYPFILVALLFSCKPAHPPKEHEAEIINSKSFMLVDVPYIHDNISGGQLTGVQISSLNEYLITTHNLDLNEINYLTVSYLKSEDDCWYDNYKMVNTSSEEKFIEKEKLQSNTTLLFLHYDKGHGGGTRKYDVGHFFYSLFPQAHGKTFCDYTITISKTGSYLLQVSHFDIKVANAFRNELEAHELKNRIKTD